ncbi:MAG TPA: hypothetical protein VIJ81_09155 [Sphingomicrobium sp.]|nr:hypothetical protein [Sphingomicrobium sp.]
MKDDLPRIKDLAKRAREMARWALNRKDKISLLKLADNYDREVAAIIAKGNGPCG